MVGVSGRDRSSERGRFSSRVSGTPGPNRNPLSRLTTGKWSPEDGGRGQTNGPSWDGIAAVTVQSRSKIACDSGNAHDLEKPRSHRLDNMMDCHQK
jgi:hypothetical protein